MVLVPSMFEPCGLTQLVGLQYGGVPVVRRTGGLADTVHDVDDSNCPELANGFCFDGTDEASLNGALDRALEYVVVACMHALEHRSGFLVFLLKHV